MRKPYRFDNIVEEPVEEVEDVAEEPFTEEIIDEPVEEPVEEVIDISEEPSEPYQGNNLYDPKVKAAAILIAGGTDPEEACKDGIDILLAKKAALKILDGSYFGKN